MVLNTPVGWYVTFQDARERAMSDSRHISKATLNVVAALRNPEQLEQESTERVDAIPYAERPVVDNVLKHEELTVALNGMKLPNVPAIKLMRKDAHGRPVPGAALSISMGCGQTGQRSKSVDAAIRAVIPRDRWAYIGSYHRTNGSMVGVINMLQTCLANTNRASSANLPSAFRRSIASSVPYYPCRSLEDYPVDGMRKLGLESLFKQGDETVNVNPKSDAGIYYRNPAKYQLPVKNQEALRRAQQDVEYFLKRLTDRPREMEKVLEIMAQAEPLRFLALAKPKMELCKVSEFGVKHRLISVFPLWEQLVAASVSLRTHKRVLNFLQDPASPFMHNAGWHGGNAARMIDRSCSLGEGLWMPNAGDDALGFAVQLVVRPMTKGEVRARARGEHVLAVQLSAYRARRDAAPPVRPKRPPRKREPVVAVAAGTDEAKTLLDDALSKRVAASHADDAPTAAAPPPLVDDSSDVSDPVEYTYTLWDDSPVVLERPWASELPIEVARRGAIIAPDIKRFDLSLLAEVWQQVVTNCTMSLGVNPSKLMVFLIEYLAYRYFYTDVLFHRSEIMRAKNIGKAGYHMTTPFNSQIVSCINLQHRTAFHVSFSTRNHKTPGPAPPGAHGTFNAHVGRLYYGPIHPDDWFKVDYVVRPAPVLLSQESLSAFFAEQVKNWSSIGINYKQESIVTHAYDFQAPRVTLPFLNHTIVPWTYDVEGKKIRSYIAVYAQPDKSLASLLNGMVRQGDDANGPPPGAILMSQAVCIALGNCTNKEVYDVCKIVFERESENGRTPVVDEQYLDGYAITDDIDVNELLFVPRNVTRPAFPTMERLQLFSLPSSYRKGLAPMYVNMSGVASVPSAPGGAPMADPNPFAALRSSWVVSSPADDAAPVHVRMPHPTTDRAHAGQLVETEEHKLARKALLAEHARKHRAAQEKRESADQRHYDQAAADDAQSVAETTYDYEDDPDDDSKSVHPERDSDGDDPDIDDDAWARQQAMEDERYGDTYGEPDYDDDNKSSATVYSFGDRPKNMRGGGNEDDAEEQRRLEEMYPRVHPDDEVKTFDDIHITFETPLSDVLSASTPVRDRVFNARRSHWAVEESLQDYRQRVALAVPRAADAYDAVHDANSDASSAYTVDEEYEAYLASMYENCEVTDDEEMYGPPPEDYPESDADMVHDCDALDDVERTSVHVLLQFRGQTRVTTFEVDDDVATVRRAAAIYFPTEYVNIRLVHAGRDMRDSDMLYEVGVRDGARIEVMLRLLGGGKAPPPSVISQNANTNESGALHAPAAAAVRRAKRRYQRNMGRSKYNANTMNPTQDLRKGAREVILNKIESELKSVDRAVKTAANKIGTVAKRTGNRGAQRPGFRRLQSAGGGLPMFGGVPANKAHKPRGVGIPSIRQLANGGERFSCKQLVGGGEIFGLPNVFTKIIDQPLNAGNSVLWSKLADRAKAYERFIIRKAELHYTGTCNTLSAGTLMGYVEKDPTDVAVGTAREVFDNPTTNFMVSVIERNWSHNLNYRAGAHYVHMGDAMVTDDAEKRQDNPGVLRVYLDQVDSTGLRGYLYINYVVDLIDPRESVPDAIDFHSILTPAMTGSNTIATGNAVALYPLNLSSSRMNAGFALPNWYLAGTPTSAANWTHTAGILSAMTPRASNVYYDDGITASPVVVAPAITRCSVFNVPAGSYRLTAQLTVNVATQASGTCEWKLQYGLCDSLDAGFSVWVDMASVNSTGVSVVSAPGGTTRSLVTITGAPGRYLALRAVLNNTSGVVVGPGDIAIAGNLTRAAASIDAIRAPSSSMTYHYPSQSAALMSALADFDGDVILEFPPLAAPLTLEERLSLLEREREDDTVSIVSRATPAPTRRS